MEEEGSRQGTRIQTEDFSVTCSGPKHLRRWPTTHCKTAPRGEQRKSSPTASCPPRCGLDTKRSAEETSGSPLLGRTPACVLYRKMWRKVLVLPCERSVPSLWCGDSCCELSLWFLLEVKYNFFQYCPNYLWKAHGLTHPDSGKEPAGQKSTCGLEKLQWKFSC